MQPDHRRTPAARLVFRHRFRAVRGSIPLLSAWWHFAPVLLFLIGGPVFAQGVSAPSNLAASAGDGEVTLTWDEPRDLATTGFEVRYARRGMDPPEAWNAWNDIDWKPKPDSDTATHTVEGLTNRFEYTFEVRGFAGDDRGEASRVRATPVPPPAPPDGLRASGSDGTVNLAWEDPMDLSITVYQIRYGDAPALLPDWNDGENIAEIGTGMTRHEVRNLTNWTEYTFEVRAKNEVGPGDAGRVTFFLGPAPSRLAASAGDGEVTLTWDEPYDVARIGFEVRYYRSDMGPQMDPPHGWYDIGWKKGIESDTATHTVEGLTNGFEYTFEVRGFTGEGRGQASGVTVRMPPGAPEGLMGSSGVTQVTLTWADPADASITGYQVRYEESGTALPDWSADHDIDNSNASTTTHPVEGLTIGREYRFEVRAKAGEVYGEASGVTVTTELAAPTNLRATVMYGNVVLTWDAAVAPGGLVTGYQILRRYVPSPGYGVFRVIATTGPTATTYEDESVGFGGRYIFRVKAMYGDVLSRWSKWARAYVPEPPAAPEGLVAMEGDGMVTLTWDDAENDALTGYQVRYAQRDAALPAWSDRHNITSTASTTTHEVTGLTDGTAYTFEVRAIAGDDEGASPSVTATPVPAKPANFRAASGNRKVTLTWSDPNDDAVIGYQYHYYSGDAPAQIAWRDTAVTTSHAVTGLTNGTEYTFEVRAKAGIVHGDSARAMATPGPTVTPPPTPCQTLSINEISNVTVNVNESFSRTARATGGCDAIRITVTGQPTGVTIESVNDRTKRIRSTGLSAPGTHTVTVEADDAEQNMATRTFTITVCDRIDIDSIGDFSVQEGTEFDRTVPVSGGCGTRTSERELGPTWVEHEIDTNSNLRIHGTAPSTPGTHDVRVRVQAEGGNSDTEPFTITVTREEPDCEIEIAEIDDVTVTEGDSFSRTASATANCPPITYTKLGAWPSWVTLDANSGRIGGTAPSSAAGTNPTVTVRVTDARGNHADDEFTINVRPDGPCPTIRVDAGDDMTVAVNGDISRTVTATGGGTSHTFSLSIDPSSGLDLSIGETNGSITGNASKAGTYTVTVNAKAANAPSCPSGSDDFIVMVDCPDISVGGLRDVTVKLKEAMSSMTATASGGQSPYRYAISGQPGTVGINETTGVISGNVGNTAGEFTVEVEATDDCGCTGTREFKITVECPTIPVEGLRNVTVTKGSDIPTMTASADEGQPPYTYRKKSGAAWVNVSSSGLITGTVQGDKGTYPVVVTATDACECTGEGSLTINVTDPLEIGPIADVDALVDVAISPITPTASGGIPPYTFTMSGAPSSLSIVASTGRITGTPRQARTYTVRVTVRDDDDSAYEDFQLRVTLPLRLASISNVVASRHEAISAIQVSATGGKPPYDYSLTASPSSGSGLSISSSGSITGAPTAVGSFTMRVTVTDDDDNTNSRSFTMLVAEPIIIGPIADMYGEYLASFSEGPVDVSGGVTPYRYSLSGQPSGLGVSNTGVISGTPTASGDFDVTLTVTGEHGRTESSLFFMTISSGDFNRDGRADAEDSKLFKEKMGLRRSDTGYDRRMDMNGDGMINWADFVILGRHIERDASSQSGQ